MILIVPNFVRDKINEKLDAALEKVPEAKADRDILYNQLLAYFNEHGEVPDFDLAPRTGLEQSREAIKEATGE